MRSQRLSNHELGKTFPASPAGVDARISKHTLNDKTHGVLSATYLFNGSEGFKRFCSATLEVINGTPYYFTGEEAINAGHDGSSIVMNARSTSRRTTSRHSSPARYGREPSRRRTRRPVRTGSCSLSISRTASELDPGEPRLRGAPFLVPRLLAAC
jgi:hypothetical protein